LDQELFWAQPTFSPSTSVINSGLPMADSSCESMLKSAVQSIAACIVNEEQLTDSGGLHCLYNALLAECVDESDSAALRCASLRGNIVVAMLEALSQLGGVGKVLANTCGKTEELTRVRVEIRGSAGRQMTQGAFTVGTAPECDVQIFGDHTVQPLQCLVIPLPGGIVVVDAWPNGATKVMCQWKRSIDGRPGVAHEGHGTLILERNDRVVLSLGARTAIALGPGMKELCRKAVADDCKCARMINSQTTTTCGSFETKVRSLSPGEDCSEERGSKRIKLGSLESSR